MSKSPNTIARVALIAASMAMVALAVIANRDQQPIAPLGFANPGGGFVPPTRMNPGTGGGDITDVIAGAGLTGGGTTGGVTLNVGCGSGLTCAADTISIDPSALFSTLNVIPKGDGTGLTASSLRDLGDGRVFVDKVSSAARMFLGDDTSVTTASQNGLSFAAFSDGNNYIDSKTSANSTVFRVGNGAETGFARTWLTVTNSTGATGFTSNMIVGSSSSPATRLHVRGSGGSSGLTPTAGTVVTVENTAADNYISLLNNTNDQGVLFGNSTSANDGRIVYTTGRNMDFYAGNAGPWVSIASTGLVTATSNFAVSGNATLGDTPASDTHTINGVTTIKGGSTTNQLRLSDAIGNYWGLGRDNLSSGDFHISTSAGTKIAVSSSTANNTLVINSSSKATFGADLAINGNTTIGNANTDTLTVTAKINSNVHYTGTATTVSSCGTASSSVTGNNRRGKIIPGTASPTSCTLNFAGGGDAWASAPVCQVTGQKGTELITSISTSTLVIGSGGTGWSSAAGGGADQPIYYSCDGL